MANGRQCFVCGNPIKLTGIYQDNALYIGKGEYRHKHRCNALSKNYQVYISKKPIRKEEEEEVKNVR